MNNTVPSPVDPSTLESLTPTRPTPQGEAPSLLVFPTDFPVKILGQAVEGFAETMVAVVLEHAPDFDAATLERRVSSGGKYLSITATINATSREQLDALYRALSGHPLVEVVL